MKKPEILKKQEIKVVLRKDFYDVLKQPLRELLELTGANYFAHQLIDNYYQPGHFISTFHTHEDWQDNYWSNFWDQDPFARVIHKNARTNGLSVSLWQISDPDSTCMEARMQMCNVHDGVAFAYQHKSGALEHFTLAWNKFDLAHIDPKKIDIIQEKLLPIRLHHRQVYQDVK